MSTPHNANKEAIPSNVAKIGALVATFFILPLFHDVTLHLIETFTAQHYGYAYVSYAGIGWFIIGGLFVYMGSQLLISIVLKFILNIPKFIALLFFIGR